MDKFKEYVTGAAFSITLSKPMIDSLCYAICTHSGVPIGTDYPGIIYPGSGMGSWNAIERRGLVEWTQTTNECGFLQRMLVPTDAGRALYQMLIIADLVKREYLCDVWEAA